MTKTTHLLIQCVLTAMQFVPYIVGFPSDAGGRTAWAGLVAAFQGLLGAYVHGFNPDGTPATEPYRPKDAKDAQTQVSH